MPSLIDPTQPVNSWIASPSFQFVLQARVRDQFSPAGFVHGGREAFVIEHLKQVDNCSHGTGDGDAQFFSAFVVSYESLSPDQRARQPGSRLAARADDRHAIP